MTKNNETGHARNLSHFEQLVIACTSLSSTYNPSKATLTIANLQALLSNCKMALRELSDAKTSYQQAVNVRMESFSSFSSFCTRIVSALANTDSSLEVIKDAKSILRKINGKRATPVVLPSGEESNVPKTISVSQRSYDFQIDHLASLISLIKSIPSYQPNEADLQINNLEVFINSLREKNTQVFNTYASFNIARNKIADIMYNENTGAIHTALMVKEYVKSIFSAKSNEYKQIRKLSFKTIK